MKIALVTNVPTPYRIPIYNRISKKFGGKFTVIFCAKYEPHRSWNLPEMQFDHVYLKENIKAKADGYNFVHNNLDVFHHLKRLSPDVTVTTGYNPTHLYAWIYSVFSRSKHVPMTDGWIESEKNLSSMHRMIRKMVFKTSHAYIGAGKNSLKLFESYGIPSEKIFQSHLCIDNERFKNNLGFNERGYHIMFSGAFHKLKRPLFFAEVAKKLAMEIPDFKVLILGNGELKRDFLDRLDHDGVNYDYPGYAKQESLPGYYSQAKLFLFPTKLDAWGLVANEALASGTPVITTSRAGIVNDLLIDGKNGFILPVDADLWCDKLLKLLRNEGQWNQFSQNAFESVEPFNFDSAADGFITACEYATRKPSQ